MAHLEDRLAEFVFKELNDGDMETARRHVAQCLECQSRVAGFQSVCRSLEKLPELDVPRRMVFMPPGVAPRKRGLSVAWGIPFAIAAGLILAVVFGGPLRFERNESGFAVSLGSADAVPPPAQTAEPRPLPVDVAAVPASLAIDYAELDYGEIVDRIRAGEAAWIRSEIERRIAVVDAENDRKIQRVLGEFQYLTAIQRIAQKEMYANAASIQLLAERGGDE